VSDRLSLLDYRRRVADLYAQVRGSAAIDPAAAHQLWRAGRDQLFGEHPQSPLNPQARKAFTGLKYFPYDPGFRFVAQIEPASEPGWVEIPVSEGTDPVGTSMMMERFGEIELPMGRLAMFWIDVYGGGILLLFRDATSGRQTYGAGRYLLDTIKGADLGSTPAGELIVDFNFAFNPSCHYDECWSCPLAPPQNWLEVEIAAGEQSYRS